MRSCPQSRRKPQLMIVASSPSAAYGVRGRGVAKTASVPTSTSSTRSLIGLGQPLTGKELCESWIESTLREHNPSIYKPNVGQYLQQLNSHINRVRLVSSCLPHTTGRGHLESSSINELPLEGLQIRGLRVRKRPDSRRSYYPKEDSENRARRYLVEVDQHLGGGGISTTPPRHREALPQSKSLPIKASNPVTKFNLRRPVDPQRDRQRLSVDHIGHHQNSGQINRQKNKPGSPSSRPKRQTNSGRQSGTKNSNPKSPEKRKRKTAKDSTKAPIPSDEIPLITVEGFPPERAHVRSQPHSPPIQKEEEEEDEQEEEEDWDDRDSEDDSFSRANYPDAIYNRRGIHPRAVFTVTVRTAEPRQQLIELQHPYPGESSKQPATLPGTQEPDLGAISSAHVSLTTTRGSDPSTTTPGRTTCRHTAPPRSLQLLAGRRYVQKHRSDASSARYIAPRSYIALQSATQHRPGYTCSTPPPEGKALVVQQFQLTLPFDEVLNPCEGSAFNSQCLSPIVVSPICATSSSGTSSRSDIKLRPPSQQPFDMANETETQQNMANSQVNGQVKHMKGYRKKGLVSEKVLLERLSDMSIEDDLLNPVITLSSVEDDDDSPMEEGSPKPGMKGTLKKSLSLAVPSLNLAEEPKRPPL